MVYLAAIKDFFSALIKWLVFFFAKGPANMIKPGAT